MYWTKHVGGALSIYALHAEIPEALGNLPSVLTETSLCKHD